MKAVNGRTAVRLGRSGALGALVVTGPLWVAACGSSDAGPGSSPASATSAVGPSTAPTTTDSGPALEGSWQTGDVTVEDMVSALRRAGLQKWIQPFRARAGMGGSNVFRLSIAAGSWREEYSRNGGPFQDFDDAAYTVSGHTVALTRGAGSYRWQVSGTTLRLSFVAHSMSGSDSQSGLPGEVLQRAFYTAAPFRRRA